MTNELKAFTGTSLSLDAIAAGLNNTLTNAPTVDSKADALYLNMRGPKDWVIGRDKEAVHPGDEFVVVIEGFTHGFIAWHGGRPEFKEMVSITVPLSSIQLPDPNSLKAKNGIEDARGMTLAGTGDWAGKRVEYNINSLGGREAIETILKAVRQRIFDKEKALYPLVTLDTDGYIHKEHGPITKPVFNIVSWLTKAEALAMAADEDQPLPEAEPEPEPAPKPVEEPKIEDAEIVSETASRRRRRAS